MKKFASVAALAVAGLVGNAFGAATYINTVGTYAASVSPTGSKLSDHVATPGTDSVSGAAAVGNVTAAQFSNDVLTAFNNNTGGIWNGEASSAATIPAGAPAGAVTFAPTGGNYGDGAANAIFANYGNSLSNQISFYESNGAATQGFSPNSNGAGNSYDSGVDYIGFSGNQLPVITFSQGLSEVGLTLTGRGAQRTVVMRVNLTSGGTITSTAETTNTPAVGTGNLIFFGFQAPTNDSIASLQIVSSVDGAAATQFGRYDDLGFIVATPEPASLSLLGLGGLALLRRRRA